MLNLEVRAMVMKLMMVGNVMEKGKVVGKERKCRGKKGNVMGKERKCRGKKGNVMGKERKYGKQMGMQFSQMAPTYMAQLCSPPAAL